MINFTVDNIFDFLNLNGYAWDYLVYNDKYKDFLKAKTSDFELDNYNLLSLKDKVGRTATVYSCLITNTNFEIYGFDNNKVEIYLERNLNNAWVNFLATLKTATK